MPMRNLDGLAKLDSFKLPRPYAWGLSVALRALTLASLMVCGELRYQLSLYKYACRSVGCMGCGDSVSEAMVPP